MRRGLLIKQFLQGKFVKFNNNTDGASIDLVIGEVLLTDFVQVFSHWVYEFTDHKMIVCDLQGKLDMEGRWPIFRLTTDRWVSTILIPTCISWNMQQ